MDQPSTTHTPNLRPDVDVLDLGGLPWRTSSYSSGHGGNCVEVAPVVGGGVVVRHSRFPAAAVIAYSDDEWNAFTLGVAAGEFQFTRP